MLHDFLVFCQCGKNWISINYFKPGDIISNVPWLSGVRQAGKSWISITYWVFQVCWYHDFLVLDKLATKCWERALIWQPSLSIQPLGMIVYIWGEWWWKVRTKVSAIIMMRIGGQTDLSDEICAYERRCLTCVNHDSSCIQCITTYTSLKMVMTRAYPVWYSE